MGRPPCCDKVGIKKGPWTPEEDIILVSYIQEHGPGNWRAVPTNTGLMRCSKSCRLRWTNYLRPGIKRGNFTLHEEGMIIHLQALLGNKWAAIATYLPQRTDNDIKNYWNTHLKKKLKKFQSGMEPDMASHDSAAYHPFVSRSSGERSVVESSNGENSSVYASSAENISRLLEGWMRSSSSHLQVNASSSDLKVDKFYGDFGKIKDASAAFQFYKPHKMEHDTVNGMPSDHDHHDLDNMISSFGDRHHDLSGMAREKSSSESSGFIVHDQAAKIGDNPPLSFLEKWLLDESAGQVEGMMELPRIF